MWIVHKTLKYITKNNKWSTKKKTAEWEKKKQNQNEERLRQMTIIAWSTMRKTQSFTDSYSSVFPVRDTM